MGRCAHKATALFESPHAGDTEACLSFLLGNKRRWVRCSTCGATGYHGRSRINWHYGGPGILEQAQKWNAWIGSRPTIQPQGDAKP